MHHHALLDVFFLMMKVWNYLLHVTSKAWDPDVCEVNEFVDRYMDGWRWMAGLLFLFSAPQFHLSTEMMSKSLSPDSCD